MKNNLVYVFFRRNLPSYLIGLIFMFSASYIQTLFPKVLGHTIDIMKVNGFNKRSVLLNIFYILLITLGTLISTYLWRNLVIGNSRKMEIYLRENLFHHLQSLSPEFYSKRKTGDLIAYAINDINAVRMTFGPALALSFNSLVICASSIYFMLISISIKLTLITLAPLPFVIFVMTVIGKLVQVRFKKVQENFGALTGKVQENICGIRVIKAYVQENQEIESFENLSTKMMDSVIKMVRTSSYLAPIIDLCFNISFVTNLIFGGNLVLRGSISLGDFIAFNTYLVMIMTPIVSISKVITIFQRGMASLERLNEIFSIQPDIAEKSNALDQKVQGAIEFKDLSFSYPGSKEMALQGINLYIPQGQTLGIIGKTGSGKSTLANLLFKLYNIKPGEIFLDGQDINDYSLKAIRDSFGYVPQDTFLFSATIKNNIAFFKDTYSEDEVEKASQYSNIYDSIMGFPDAFQTMLGERGINLSGGQKQRVAIARALIKNPAVLILDDALSAVDTVTQAHILKTLKTLNKTRTTLIISHRVSAVADADQIIVLDKGRISEKGTHSNLLERGGLYYDIYTDQIKVKEKACQFEAI